MLIQRLPLIGGASTDVPAGGVPLVDPYIANVVFLLNPTGADGAVSFTDLSPSSHGTVSTGNGAVGNIQIDTGVTDGGNPTILFDGNGDAGRWADSADWQFGPGAFSIEERVRFNSTTGQQYFVSQWQSAGNLAWIFAKESNGDLRFGYSTDGTAATNVTAAWGPSTGSFYDVGVNYDGNKIRLFVDGSMIGSSTPGATTLFNSTNRLCIGSNDLVTQSYFNGWMSRLRVTKGSDRGYGDSGYTPQAAGHFPTS